MKFSIAPRWDIIFTAALTVIGFVAGGQIGAPPHTDPAVWAVIQDWAVYLMGWFTALSLIFPALSSAKSGPLVWKPAPPSAQNPAGPGNPVVSCLIIGLLALAVLRFSGVALGPALGFLSA